MGTECISKGLDLLKEAAKTEEVTIDSKNAADNPGISPCHTNEATTTSPKISDSGEVKVKRTLRQRRGIHYGGFDITSEDESDCSQPEKDQFSKNPQRNNEMSSANKSKPEKESLKWYPEEARRPAIDEAPVFYPTEEDFKDTLGYIASIRPKAEKYGICRIIPPSSWLPPCPLKEMNFWESATFTTRIQQVDKLQNREPMRKRSRNRCQRKRKRRKRLRFGMTRRRNSSTVSETSESVGSDTEEKFGFQNGSDFTLDMFQKYADEFKKDYFGVKDAIGNSTSCDMDHDERWHLSMEDIEGEYWRIVEDPMDEVEVHYGADLDTGVFGSGFPKASSSCCAETDPYLLSGWNLNNLSRLRGSVLSFEKEDISGVLVPWLYVGMCFSSFCWHVEDHFLYSLNYMHFGEPKIWYGVPGNDAVKLEDAMRKHLPELFEEQPDLLHELVTQLSPSVLKSEGIPVYRAIQRPGEFVLTFPRAYHSGFNCGYNCAEAVNVAPVDWLPHGQCAVELYGEQHRKTSLSYDKLLLCSAMAAVKEISEHNRLQNNSGFMNWHKSCGRDGILTEAVKLRVDLEHKRRDSVSGALQVRKIGAESDLSPERECFLCSYDLHLSAATCECSPNRFACLTHTSSLCSCEPNKKILLSRYDLDELDALVEVLEGDPSKIKLCWFDETGVEVSVHSKPLEKPNSSITGADLSICCLENSIEMCNYGHLKHSEQNNSPSNQEPEFHDINMSGSLDNAANRESGSCPKAGKTENYLNRNADATTCNLKLVEDVSHSPIKCDQSSAANNTILCSSTENKARVLFPDLNCTEGSYDFKYATKESNDECLNNEAVMSAVKGEETLIPNNFKLDGCSRFTITNVNGDGSKRLRMDPEASRKTDNLISISSDCGSSGSQYLSSGVAHKGFYDGLFSKASSSRNPENHRKSSPKIFGIELECPIYSSSVPSPCQSSQPMNFIPASMSSEREKVCKVTKHCIEPINFGRVMHGRNWCSREAIFPNGFKSRVRFFSMLDPTVVCSYISEVLEAGLLGPLFKVTVEDRPEVNFTCISASQCWDEIRARLNLEILRQGINGRQGLPPLQTPDSMDGLRMFGFLSPQIILVIEALDPYHICSEYWLSKLNMPQVEAKDQSPELAKTSSTNISMSSGQQRKRKLFGVDLNENASPNSHDESIEIQPILKGMFQKASLEELKIMQEVMCSKSGSCKWIAAYEALREEIEKNVQS